MIRKLADRLPGDSAALDAQLLLAHISGHDRAWWLSHPEGRLTRAQAARLEKAVSELQAGKPLPYILGHWGFFGLDFIVTPDVLIPRPETELMVETALAHLRARPENDHHILDIGTGSGIIAVSLAVHYPLGSLTAVDISPEALTVARQNAERNGVSERINFIRADLLPYDLRAGRFDLVCANLPYIPTATLHGLEVFGKEPTLALDGGPEGLDLIRRLLAGLAGNLPAQSLVLLEIEQHQGMEVSALAEQVFPGAEILVRRDLAGFDRLVMIETE